MDSPERHPRARLLGRILRLITAGYAVVLVVATHIPRLDVGFRIATPLPPDKLLHFAAYGVLGVLVSPIAMESRANWQEWFPRALAAIAVFALLDEITQPMFGRAAESFDWVADLIGAAAGLFVSGGFVAAIRTLRPSSTVLPGSSLVEP